MSADDLSSKPAAMEYDSIVATSNTKGTNQTQVTALKRFKQFLETKQILTPIDELSVEFVCNIRTWEEFGTYLAKFAMKKDEDLLMWGAAKVNLTQAKVYFERNERYSGNQIWIDQKWYSDIRDAVEKTILHRCVELGIPLVEKADPVGRELMRDMCDAYMKRGTSEDFQWRAATLTTFLAVGRAGEVAFSSYNLARWNTVYNCLFLEWSEIKTNAQKPMNFFPDAEHMELDFYHAMACYFIVGAGSSSITSSEDMVQDWIFPFLRTNTSSKMADSMRSLAVPGVPADVT